jgi:integrase
MATVYQRDGRPTWYFQGRIRNGRKQLSSCTGEKKLATKIGSMWSDLADARAWELLDPVLAGQKKMGELWDLYVKCNRNITEMKRQLHDIDLEPLVDEFLRFHAETQNLLDDTIAKTRTHLRWLIPADVKAADGTVEHRALLRSLVTEEWLEGKLLDYKGGAGTKRRVHSDWSVFFHYCFRKKKLFPCNLMDLVDRAPAPKMPPRFYRLPVVQQIVNWQPDARRKALFALSYGAAIEISVILGDPKRKKNGTPCPTRGLTRGDLDVKNHEIRAAGTKTHTRDRIAKIAEWAWPIVWAHARTVIGDDTLLFPETWSRYTASDWHADTVGTKGIYSTNGEQIKAGLGLTERLPLHCARHHWAVYMLSAGAPVAIVQEQLGHGTAKLTLDTYGKFCGKQYDRAVWEKKATAFEKERQAAEEQATEETGSLEIEAMAAEA